jgi:hypothetical protein
MWNRERHGAMGHRGAVNKVTYRTPDYMLSSAQDYRPGEKGDRQHIWQATMGADAVVFVTHPACVSQADDHCLNAWCGNRTLPRVAQWKETLIAVHKLPQDDWMGFTHAYFPIYTFDEHEFALGRRGRQWAFARKDGAYLALTAARGFELIKQGPDAYRELRSYGQQNVWLCLMGRPDTDGLFHEFQQKVLGLDVEFQELAVRCSSHRGEALSFGWDEPLLVDGNEQALSGFQHYENPYCTVEPGATEMEIRTEHYAMTLHFALSGGA